MHTHTHIHKHILCRRQYRDMKAPDTRGRGELLGRAHLIVLIIKRTNTSISTTSTINLSPCIDSIYKFNVFVSMLLTSVPSGGRDSNNAMLENLDQIGNVLM